MIGQGSYKAAESETQQLAAAPAAAAAGADHQRRSKPHPNQVLKCPRCESLDTKFCYYNNYSLTQPRYFCKNCKRYWTAGGTLRNVPVGGGLRKNKRSKQKAAGLGVNKSDHHIGPSLEQSLPGHPNIGLTAAAGSSNSSNSAPEIANLIPYPNIVPPADNKFVYDSGRMGQSTKLINPAAHTAGGTPLQHFRGSLGSHIYSYGSLPLQEGLQQYVANESAIGAGGGGTYAVNNYTFLPPSRPHQSAAVAHSAAMLSQATEARDPSSYANREFGTAGLDQQSTTIHTQNLSGDELKQEPRSDEAGSGSANPAYDWQMISEGLFGGTPGDYFYLPGGNWPDLAQFTADPAGPAG